MYSGPLRSRSAAALALFTYFWILQDTFAQLNTPTSKGCFSSSSGLLDQGSYEFQTSGYCQKLCVGMNKPVMALTGGSNCLCGDLLPPQGAKTQDSDCSSPCNGYGQASCGGQGKYSVFLTGTQSNVGSASDDSKPNDSKAGNAKQPDSPPPDSSVAPEQSQVVTAEPAVITVGGSTIVRTLPGSTATVGTSDASAQRQTQAPAPSPTSADDSGTSTGSKVGIAVGIVVGVLALAAIVGAGFFFWKRRKNAETSSRHRHNASVGPFAGSGSHGAGQSVNSLNGPATGALASSSDTRLDPTMVERRQSDGSVFEDSADYSRRILKVTNPSG